MVPATTLNRRNSARSSTSTPILDVSSFKMARILCDEKGIRINPPLSQL